MLEYSTGIDGLRPEQLAGFFVGWPSRPDPETHLAVLRGAYRVVVALDAGQVVGFVHAISDGVLTAFVPWLEVLPSHQGRGVGSSLVRRMMAELAHLYSVDLTCDPALRGYYERLGLLPLQGMGWRNRAVLG